MRKDITPYYRALGLSPGAGPLEIRKAYRQMVQQWHPDLYKPGSPMQTTAEDITKEINEAYEQLYRKKLHRQFPSKKEVAEEPADEAPEAPKKEPDVRKAGAKTRSAKPARARWSRGSGTAQPQRPPRTIRFQWRGWIQRNRRRHWFQGVFIICIAAAGAAAGKKIWDPLHQLMIEASYNSESPLAVSTQASNATSGGPRTEEHRATAPLLSAKAASESPVRAPDFRQIAFSPTPSLIGANPDFRAPESDGLIERADALLDVFEIGDTKAKVIAIQGAPDDAGDSVFRYGSSVVYFRNGIVRGWLDRHPRLRVRTWETISVPTLDTFSIGSTRGDVIRAQGDPAQFTPTSYSYGASAVYFENGRVTGWTNGDVRLRGFDLPRLEFIDLDRLIFR